jgi:murein DD-endopeptidase MepM/ murein hydrolase activator NlpD
MRLSGDKLVGRHTCRTAQPRAMLRRACACGGHAGVDGECAECRQKRLQRQGDGSPAPRLAPPVVHSALGQGGRPLDGATRGWAEARLGHDFSSVRVHTGSLAERSARSVGALAYTVGQHVVFGAGQYRPEATSGRRLLAHELAHTVQQRGFATSGPLRIGRRDDAAEREAEGVASGRGAVGARSNAILRRVPESAKSESYDEIAAREIAGALRKLVCAVKTVDPVRAPLADMSTFQSPGASGWWGAKFGKYRNSCTRQHKGWDIHAPEANPVFAVVAGRLSRHVDAGGLGNFVRLTSAADNKRAYLYAHLSAREPAGQVCVGDKVGETGVSGNASADRPHLHFQVQHDGVAQDPATMLTMPTMVVEATGNAATAIDFSEADPC